MPLTREEPEPKLSSLSFYHEMRLSLVARGERGDEHFNIGNYKPQPGQPTGQAGIFYSFISLIYSP